VIGFIRVLEVERVTYIYWQIHCLSIVEFVIVLTIEGVPYIYWQIDYPSIVEFVRVLVVERITYIYWQIDCPSIIEFVKVLAIERVTYIYWQINCPSLVEFVRDICLMWLGTWNSGWVVGVGTLLLDMGKVSSKLRVQIPWECLNLAMFMLYNNFFYYKWY
jgi:hypothetical protein